MTALIKAFGGVKGEIVFQDDTKTVLRLPVTRFGSPNAKDLHGEYFCRDCYFGDDLIQTKFAFYDHLLNPLSNPYAPQNIESQIIGKATLAKTDDKARWFDFEIVRSHEYHDYVLALNEEGVLGTSTQSFRGGKRKNADDGITHWVEGEVTLTVTPADYQSVPALQDLAKSFGLPALKVVDAAQGGEDEPAGEEQTAAAAAETTEDVEAQMAAILSQENVPAEASNKTASANDTQIDELIAQVKTLTNGFGLFKAWVWGSVDLHGSPGEGESLFDVLRALQDLVGQNNTQTQKTQKALLTSPITSVKN